MTDPIQYTARDLDLGPRLFRTTAVAASPTGAVETIVATLTLTEDLAVSQGVYLFAQIGFTVGTNGVSARLRIKHTDASGATLGDTGAKTETAANLDALELSRLRRLAQLAHHRPGLRRNADPRLRVRRLNREQREAVRARGLGGTVSEHRYDDVQVSVRSTADGGSVAFGVVIGDAFLPFHWMPRGGFEDDLATVEQDKGQYAGEGAPQ